jgi:hypothetical protein
MGCNSSSNANVKGRADNKEMPEDARAFLKMVDEGQPVAQRILQEWTTFANAQEKRKGNATGSVNTYKIGVGSEEAWTTNSGQNGVTHKSVDEIGQSFLHYLRNDLCERKWGGDFTYSVAGVALQGFIHVVASVDGGDEGVGQGSFDVKLHYHTPA